MLAFNRCGCAAALAAVAICTLPALSQVQIRWNTTDLLPPSELVHATAPERSHLLEASEGEDGMTVQTVPIPPAAASGGALVAGIIIVRLLRRKQQ